jgi:hypothetical protein
LDQRWATPETLHLEVRFSVLPESVISKFIVRSHELAWRRASWWRHGIAVRDEQNRCAALVKAHLGAPGCIELRVQGPGDARQLFIAVLRDRIADLTRKLGGELWVILPGGHPQKYDDLLLLAHQRKLRTYPYVVGGKVLECDLMDVLDLIESAERQQQTLVQIGQHISGGTFHGPVGANQTFTNCYNTIQQVEKEDARQLLTALVQAVQTLTPHLRERTVRDKVERQLEWLIDEAAQPEPDHEHLALSANRLIAAAKTCGDKGSSVVRAVEAVLEAFSSEG